MKSRHLQTAICLAALMFIANFCIAQIDTSVRYIGFPQDHKMRVITDPKTYIKYELDSSHVYIVALAQNGTKIWSTDPWKDSNLKLHMAVRPKIVSFLLRNDSSTHFTKVIGFIYDNREFGQIDAKTGRLIWVGQD